MSCEEKWDVCEPYPGAMIRVDAGMYYHYGIYIGDDEVVEFGSCGDAAQKDASEIRIQRSSVDDFLCGKSFLEVRVFNRKEKHKKRADKEIIKYALLKVGGGGYDILHNNCQHFANECVFGEKGETAIDSLRKKISSKLNG